MKWNLIAAFSATTVFGRTLNEGDGIRNYRTQESITVPVSSNNVCKVKRDLRVDSCASVTVSVITVSVGTPKMGRPNVFNVLLDTGSNGLVIPSKGLQNYKDPDIGYDPDERYDLSNVINRANATNSFDVSCSSTSQGFTTAPRLFTQYSGGMKAYTTQGSDILHIGDVSQRVPVELLTSFDGEFLSHGILGAPSPYFQRNTNVALQMMDGFETKALNFYYFDVYPYDRRYDSRLFTGEVTFGRPLENRYNTNSGFVWLDILETAHWKVKVDTLLIAAFDQQNKVRNMKTFSLENVSTAFFDTGSSDILFPAAIYSKFMQYMVRFVKERDEQPYYHTKCSNISNLTDELVFRLNGLWISVKLIELFQPVPPTFDRCKLLISKHSGTDIILGTPFHRGFYTSYSYTRKQIGLAKKV